MGRVVLTVSPGDPLPLPALCWICRPASDAGCVFRRRSVRVQASSVGAYVGVKSAGGQQQAIMPCLAGVGMHCSLLMLVPPLLVYVAVLQDNYSS
jgi:hypothetical protein